MMRIQRLSPEVANQIAAGEVIERPSSVMKELLENALDSGADSIQIEVDSGGLSRIKVSDNGTGILAGDLPLAITAHATSKITLLDDLYTLNSMGFRGEALASIASVSKLSISSKPENQAHAMRIEVDGTKVYQRPCARGLGTTVEVRDLFFNAPVRKKFLKSAQREFQMIELMVKRFALSAPDVALSLKHNQKQILTLPAARGEASKLVRVKKLLGKKFVEQAIDLEAVHGRMRLYGWVSHLDYQRSQNDKQWVYINHRMVKDKLMHHAIKQAYENRLYPGRHPSCLLYLILPGEEIDVNVHPTKDEVRFQNPRLVHDFISSEIRRVIESKESSVMSAPVYSPAFSAMEIREHQTQPLRKLQKMPPIRSAQAYQRLNAHFALVSIQESPYLVDMQGLQHHFLCAQFEQGLLPLPSRPLLVPVRCVAHQLKLNLRSYGALQTKLAQFGIQVDQIGATELIVRTIPQCLPQLDIQQLFQHLDHQKVGGQSPSEFFKDLIACQHFDTGQLAESEWVELVCFLQDALTQAKPLTYCLPLGLENCQNFLYPKN